MTIQLIGDTEASGPVPGHGDLISFGLVWASDHSIKFRSPNMRPSCDKYSQGAYDSIGMTREEHLAAPASLAEGMQAMQKWMLKQWIPDVRFVLITDNPAFDFMWLATESHNHLGYCPFGHSARRIGDVWAGYKRKVGRTQDWKRLRKTKHTHDPLDDALGNAEAWREIVRQINGDPA